MNLCRTCKYWAKRDHMIGVGFCSNSYVSIRIIAGHDNRLFTSQDFGCVLHEAGESFPSIYPEIERVKILDDFLKSATPITNEPAHS